MHQSPSVATGSRPARHALKGCAPVLWIGKVPQVWPQVRAPPGMLRPKHALPSMGMSILQGLLFLVLFWSALVVCTGTYLSTASHQCSPTMQGR